MLNEHRKNFKDNKHLKTGEIGLVEYDLKEAFLNPLFDQGHSYSYQKKEPFKDKILDNFLLIIPKFDKILEKYQPIIDEDNILCELINDIKQIFTSAAAEHREEIEVLKLKTSKTFNKIIELIKIDEQELDRIETESPQTHNDTNKKDLFLKLKEELEALHSEYLVIF